MTTMAATQERTAEIGTYRDDRYVYRVRVTMRLEEQPHEGYETIDHAPAPVPTLRFSIMGSTDRRPAHGGHWTDDGAGQIVDDVRAVTKFAPGWNATKRDRLVELWERWHLNDLKAGCAHQTVEYETDRYGRRVPSLTLTQPCPITGYRYGSAWLVEPLPDDVVAEIESLFTA